METKAQLLRISLRLSWATFWRAFVFTAAFVSYPLIAFSNSSGSATDAAGVLTIVCWGLGLGFGLLWSCESFWKRGNAIFCTVAVPLVLQRQPTAEEMARKETRSWALAHVTQVFIRSCVISCLLAFAASYGLSELGGDTYAVPGWFLLWFAFYTAGVSFELRRRLNKNPALVSAETMQAALSNSRIRPLQVLVDLVAKPLLVFVVIYGVVLANTFMPNPPSGAAKAFFDVKDAASDGGYHIGLRRLSLPPDADDAALKPSFLEKNIPEARVYKFPPVCVHADAYPMLDCKPLSAFDAIVAAQKTALDRYERLYAFKDLDAPWKVPEEENVYIADEFAGLARLKGIEHALKAQKGDTRGALDGWLRDMQLRKTLLLSRQTVVAHVTYFNAYRDALPVLLYILKKDPSIAKDRASDIAAALGMVDLEKMKLAQMFDDNLRMSYLHAADALGRKNPEDAHLEGFFAKMMTFADVGHSGVFMDHFYDYAQEGRAILAVNQGAAADSAFEVLQQKYDHDFANFWDIFYPINGQLANGMIGVFNRIFQMADMGYVGQANRERMTLLYISALGQGVPFEGVNDFLKTPAAAGGTYQPLESSKPYFVQPNTSLICVDDGHPEFTPYVQCLETNPFVE